MEEEYSEMSDKKLVEEFEGHPCIGEHCELCAEYMQRFNKKRAYELGINEPEGMDQVSFEL